MFNKYYKIQTPIFDGDGDGDGGADDKGGAGGDGGDGGSTSFTQEQVNSMIAKERKAIEDRYKSENEERLKELKLAQSKANLNKSQREEMEKKIKELETKVYSAEELAERERNKLLDEATRAKEELTAERDSWRTRHNEAQIGRDITDAAVAADAISPRQIEAILRPTTKVVEEKDAAGNPTFSTRVILNVKDSEGKDTQLVMAPQKAVEHLKDNPEYFNLFKGTAKNGLGEGNAGGGSGNKDYSKMSVEEYRKSTRGK
jgi:hypothetical protein